jgi:hypothetical protein
VTPNPLYQGLVRELEALMAPRIASRVLREGLAAVGADPETLTAESAEALLKGSVFRQLQTARPPDQARAAVGEIVARLKAFAVEAPVPRVAGTAPTGSAPSGPAPTGPAPVAGASRPKADGATASGAAAPRDATVVAAEKARIDALRAALRPLNLYFGWAEVRKLRAQVQLVDDELGAGRDPTGLVDDAEAQLEVVERKLEDHLVLQARDLADLEESMEVVAGLGGNRVRRLESLIATVRDAQAQRTIAEGEVERAQKLARDLRKLVESSVLDEGEAPPDLGRGDGRRTLRRDGERRPRERAGSAEPDAAAAGGTQDDGGTVELDDVAAEVAGIEASTLDPEVHERLRALDVDGERRTLETLAARYAEVLRYAPAHEPAFAAVRAAHAEGRPATDALASLDTALKVEEEARRDALRREFEALRAEVEGLAGTADATEVRRAIHVVLDVVDVALPALDDVTAARDLHAEIAERAATAQRTAADAERRRIDLLGQRDALGARLDAALARAPEGLAATGEDPLARAWRALTEARELLRDDEPPDAGTLEQARDAEAAWERALAESSDDRYERLRARARELAARLGQLPDLPSLQARRAALEPELEALEGLPDLTPAHVRTLGSIVDQLFDDARAACARRLDELGRAVGDAAPDALLRTLQAAARALESGTFPDLPALEAEVRAAGDERRSDARRRYLRARQEARRLAPAGTRRTSDLEAAVADARSAVDGNGDPEPAVARLEALIGEVEGEVAERLDAFEARLDEALARFRRVALLNNDDVAAARRVLTHLDGQRTAVGRVSLGLQARLFSALADAEARIEGLQEAYEATRAIADQLVAGNLLDDVLGGFDALFGGAEPAALGDDAANGAATPWARLSATWSPYLDLEGIAGAVILDADGTIRAGRPAPGSDVAALARALVDARATWTRLGDFLGDGAPEMAVVDAGGPPTLVAPLDDVGHAIVWTTHPGTGSSIARTLRDDHAMLVELLREATGEARDHGPP